ncbi:MULTISPECIES: permease [Carboxydocella]|uniref:Predicted permease n=2 Tax=Carboxydocella TaxID=178898 RepID=A0A1T4PZR8_9FIRM|nr:MULTISPECIES: permease [Carboxydocella]AVX21242.1 putative permease [Carboxydocella thermautotrophica]AVX31674.1 putative permease [Carboxydocella thermautotrophica]SJZ97022.1 Predicted permease [Carboxydocella sporoproducens DSM 16521]GAW29288.1 permease [Carboxydocella sp. ULO1]GAW30760.1 permease [Carboxydocella sp. JDF658]
MIIVKKYKWAIFLFIITIAIYFYDKPTGTKAFSIFLSNIITMLKILPPTFVLVGLLDVWTPKETMIKYMGQHSGIKGIAVAFFLGTAAAGPLYAAFPIAALLLKKGARLAYVLFFLGVWSSTKLPIVLFEIASLGYKFTFLHIGISLPAYLVSSFFIEKILSSNSKNEIYRKAVTL